MQGVDRPHLREECSRQFADSSEYGASLWRRSATCMPCTRPGSVPRQTEAVRRFHAIHCEAGEANWGVVVNGRVLAALVLATGALAGCGGDRTAQVPGSVFATGTIPGDEPIPIIEKLGLPDKCRQPATFDQACADPIDKAYGKGAGDDAKLKGRSE
ncbi:conserved hypothetical protein [Xanthomonas citri pv. citri]|nr:conserved hypothetical protein [Xanthomonas citri pv. citri]